MSKDRGGDRGGDLPSACEQVMLFSRATEYHRAIYAAQISLIKKTFYAESWRTASVYNQNIDKRLARKLVRL